MNQRSERTTGKIDPFAARLPDGPPPSSVLILDIWPQVDGGRFGIKRVLGDAVQLWADIFKDGHDQIAAQIAYWPAGSDDVRIAEMAFVDNDRWSGTFRPDAIGRWGVPDRGLAGSAVEQAG